MSIDSSVQRGSQGQDRDEAEVSAVAIGAILIASVFMILGGAFHITQGLAALINDEFFIVVDNYAFDLDVTVWGWVHLVMGIVIALTGFALLSGAMWARLLAIFVVVASAIVNFFYIPYYPLWSLVTLVVDGLIIWALLAHGEDLEQLS